MKSSFRNESVPFFEGELFYQIKKQEKDRCFFFLHGYMEDSFIWEKLLEKTNSATYIMLDLPGHGLSLNYSHPYRLEDIADIVLKILRKEGFDKCSLIAHSMGGYIAYEFLKKHSSVLKHLILFNTHPFADTEDVIRKRMLEISLLQKGKKSLLINTFMGGNYKERARHLDIIELSKEKALQYSESGLTHALEAMIKRSSYIDVFANTGVSCTCVFGDSDVVVSSDKVSNIKFPPQAQIIKLKDSGHMSMIENPEECIRIMSEL